MKNIYGVLYTVVTISSNQSMKNGVLNEKWIGSVIHHCSMKTGVLNEKWSDR